MNKSLILIVALLSYGWLAYAQSPQKINFQTVVRDNMAVPLANQTLDLRLSVTNGHTQPYKTYYQEVFSGTTTDNFGLLHAHVGTGTPDLINYGAFNEIVWGQSGLYLIVEIDTGNGYVNLGGSEFVSVPHTFYSDIADSVNKVTLVQLQDVDVDNANDGEVLKFNQALGKWVSEIDGGSPWSLNGNKLYYSTDNVGIGTSNPGAGLTLGSTKELAFATHINPASQRDLISLFGTSDFEQSDFAGFGYETDSYRNAQGQILEKQVVYTKAEGGHRWYVNTNANGGSASVMELDEDGLLNLKPNSTLVNVGAELSMERGDGKRTIHFDASVAGKGRLTIDEIEIKGGADFAERFDVRTDELVEVMPGMVVSIDPDHTGALMLSKHAYDHKVAGIVSGGGGIAPGMVMGQEGTIADGELPIALSGRVYVFVDESKGKIKPGDMLTTSDRPGYAMKVKKSKSAQGAIIGKAMSKVNPETGMVLVLVSLQ